MVCTISASIIKFQKFAITITEICENNWNLR